MGSKNIFIVIPAYNESKTISKVLDQTKKYAENIIVVDDGSKDDTYNIALTKNIYALKHIINMGKGAALKTGCDYALRKGAEIIVVMDADGQHDPDMIPEFIKKIKEGSSIVFGYREGLESMPFVMRLGNFSINTTTKLLYGLTIRDTQCGFRAFTKHAYKNIRWKSTDYSMESEMIANLGKHKMKYAQVAIPTIYLDDYKGTTVIDGFKIMGNLIMWRFTK